MKCKSSNVPAGIKLSGHGGMNYPAILPSPASKPSIAPASKGKKNGGGSGGTTPVAVVNSPVHLNVDSYGKLHHLVGEHGKGAIVE